MPAPAMSGLASGIDSKDIIRKLVEVERAPIVRLETNKKELTDSSKALAELRKRTKTLQDALHAMASFEAAFEQKRLNTTPAGIVDGTVKKNAPPSKHTLQVLKLASNLSFASATTSANQKLPAARIVIAGDASEFKGGSLRALRDHLQKYHNKHIVPKLVQIKENESILIIDTVEQGEAALLKIEDPDGLLRSLGLVSVPVTPQHTPSKDVNPTKKEETPNAPQEKPAKSETESWVLAAQKVEGVTGKPGVIAAGGKTIEIAENSRNRYTFGQDVNNDNHRLTSLSVTASVMGAPSEMDNAPDTLTDGEKENINVKGITLETYNISRTRKKEVEQAGDYGIVLRHGEKEQKISLKGKGEKQIFPVEKDFTAIEFYTVNEDVAFNAGEVTFAVKDTPKLDHKTPQEDKTPAEAEQRRIYPNLVRAAQNAHLKIDGIDITRKSNTGLNDVIEGVGLNLLKASKDNVETEIVNDNDAAKQQVLNFVKAYNELLHFAEDVSKTAKVTEAGKYKEMRSDSGVLATNATIRQLVNGLKIHTSNPYPANREPYIRTLPQIGISTGAIGGKREEVTKGYLEVDEAKLVQMLAENPTAVKEFFSIDTNGDMRIDNGYAHVTENFLEPYTRFTRGLISEQIKSNGDRQKQIDRDIKRQEAHVRAYEAKLQTKFGNMESAVRKSKSTGNFLKQKLGVQSSD